MNSSDQRARPNVASLRRTSDYWSNTIRRLMPGGWERLRTCQSVGRTINTASYAVTIAWSQMLRIRGRSIDEVVTQLTADYLAKRIWSLLD